MSPQVLPSVEPVSPYTSPSVEPSPPSSNNLYKGPDIIVPGRAYSVQSTESPITSLPSPLSPFSNGELPDPFGSPSGRPSIKIRLPFIHSAIQDSPKLSVVTSLKRKHTQLVTHPEDDTDSDIDIMPRKGRTKKAEVSLPESPAPPLATPTMKRIQRTLDPNKPTHAALVSGATKAGSEYHDSDAEDLVGGAKDAGRPDLFRNVTWGAYVTDYSVDADFQTNPEFTQFVPGRFELLPYGTARDQKYKLVIKLLDKAGKKRIFTNLPPRDWNSHEAIRALNKRTVQQIRRNTSVRFREVVRTYVEEEQSWILANLSAGKPTEGWKRFVDEFNETFKGKTLMGTAGIRPFRSHSSLSKEVERFGADFYAKGQVLVPAKHRHRKV
ncbi:hypothetical protein DDE83_000016 [Stemphylium lycopersici]|uniref:Uncharacterized protein n=1 Tax=Stemphylium lycopersici TaxID=183478 RepID=A0A364NH78_STELY|nr:hypothetical protein DDE83_000016 [Stemphylium lycopersici]